MLEHAELLRQLHFDAARGRWTRLVAAGSMKADTDACVIRLYGKTRVPYRTITINRRRYKASRLAWFYVYRRWPTGVIDHRDGDTLNDAFWNYRDCTHTQNMWNAGTPTTNTSGFKGVSWNGRRQAWGACIRIDKKTVWLGFRDTPEKAAILYRQAALRERGEFARA